MQNEQFNEKFAEVFGDGAQPLFAEIRQSSRYHYQAEAAKQNGHPYPFKVRIEPDADDYVVKGGYGGQYRLEDVCLFVQAQGGQKTYITK